MSRNKRTLHIGFTNFLLICDALRIEYAATGTIIVGPHSKYICGRSAFWVVTPATNDNEVRHAHR